MSVSQIAEFFFKIPIFKEHPLSNLLCLSVRRSCNKTIIAWSLKIFYYSLYSILYTSFFFVHSLMWNTCLIIYFVRLSTCSNVCEIKDKNYIGHFYACYSYNRMRIKYPVWHFVTYMLFIIPNINTTNINLEYWTRMTNYKVSQEVFYPIVYGCKIYNWYYERGKVLVNLAFKHELIYWSGVRRGWEMG